MLTYNKMNSHMISGKELLGCFTGKSDITCLMEANQACQRQWSLSVYDVTSRGH